MSVTKLRWGLSEPRPTEEDSVFLKRLGFQHLAACRRNFALTPLAGLFEVLMPAKVGQNAGLFALLLEALQGSFEGLALLDTNSSHAMHHSLRIVGPSPIETTSLMGRDEVAMRKVVHPWAYQIENKYRARGAQGQPARSSRTTKAAVTNAM